MHYSDPSALMNVMVSHLYTLKHFRSTVHFPGTVCSSSLPVHIPFCRWQFEHFCMMYHYHWWCQRLESLSFHMWQLHRPIKTTPYTKLKVCTGIFWEFWLGYDFLHGSIGLTRLSVLTTVNFFPKQKKKGKRWVKTNQLISNNSVLHSKSDQNGPMFM